jgi:hypothetical protein
MVGGGAQDEASKVFAAGCRQQGYGDCCFGWDLQQEPLEVLSKEVR